MELLNEYDDTEKEFIINIGKFIFNEHKQLFEKHKKTRDYSEIWNKSNEILKASRENDVLKRELDQKNKQISELHESIYRKTEEKVSYFKEQLVEMNKEKQRLLEFFESNIEKEVTNKTGKYQDKIQELQKKVDYYYNLYVDSNKGTFYEKDLFEKLEEYNNKKLNNIWRITHVGNYSEKCDFQFRNKDNGSIILLDTKNNTAHKPVSRGDVDKFIRDINNKENNAIGGILLANEGICNKKLYEMNVINNKIAIYISHFSFTNVEFIFTTLDTIMEMNKVNNKSIDDEAVKKNFIDDYKFVKDRLNNNITERKKLEQRLQEISDRYFNIFNDDIELALSDKPRSKSKKNISNTVILDFEALEKDKQVIGKRSKYYLQYKKNGKDIIQYFQNNSPLNKKKEQLRKKSKEDKTIIIDTE